MDMDPRIWTHGLPLLTHCLPVLSCRCLRFQGMYRGPGLGSGGVPEESQEDAYLEGNEDVALPGLYVEFYYDVMEELRKHGDVVDVKVRAGPVTVSSHGRATWVSCGSTLRPRGMYFSRSRSLH